MKLNLKKILFFSAIFLFGFLAVLAIRLNGSFLDRSGNGDNDYDMAKKSPVRSSEIPLLSQLNKEYSVVTAAVMKSVVSLETEGRMLVNDNRRSAGKLVQSYKISGKGSGVIVTAQGHIITNTHVVENKHTVRVTLFDGRTFEAKKIGEDSVTDIAVLKIETGEPLEPLPLGNSDRVRIGELVFAIGNPFGLGETVTQGIISAKQRSFGDLQSDLLQTDAPINPGNSGGPLVNIKGEIIGINAAIYSQNRNTTGFQGVGFSIPSNVARSIFAEICEYGKPIRGYIGVGLMNLTPQIRSMLGFDGEYGVAINELRENTPAYLAGLRPGDIILSYGGQTVDNTRDLLNLIHKSHIGNPVDITYWRSGNEQMARLVVREAGLPLDEKTGVISAHQVLDNLGWTLKDPTLEEMSKGDAGVTIAGIKKGNPLNNYFRPDDLILAVDGQRVINRDDLARLLDNSQFATFVFKRGRLVYSNRVPLVPFQDDDASTIETVPALPDPPRLNH